MEKKFSLEEFVNKCNNCTYQIYNSLCDDSKKLAFDFNTISEWEKIYGSIENVAEPKALINRLYDAKNNLSFYKCLKIRNVKDEYVFLWNKDVVAKLNVWEPLAGKNILSQKWHILISVLALLDTAANDNNFVKFGGNCRYGQIKKMNFISFNHNEKNYLKFDDKRQRYSSSPMKDWIQKALNC